jgi:ParB family chromosome partitioning protein
MTSSSPPDYPLDIAALNEAADCETPDHIPLDLDPSVEEDFVAAAPTRSGSPPLPEGAEVFLDTATIRESGAPNRDASSYADAAFEELKTSIRLAGKNISAIKVRRVKRVRSRGIAHVLYEVVYGHRRLRACQELGLKVLAVIDDDMDDRTAFLERVSENTGRSEFTPLELGKICIHALETKLFATQKQLAIALGRDAGDISKAIALAKLPPAVVAAFDCPGDLQYRHAKPLRDAVARDLDAVLVAAEELAQEIGPKVVSTVLARLTRDATAPIGPSNSAQPIPLVWQETNFGALEIGAGGHVTIRILDRCRPELAKLLVVEMEAFYGMHLSDLPDSRHQRRLGRGS